MATVTSDCPLVKFVPGTAYAGFAEVMLPVAYIAGFARGVDGLCAFCNGDPCNEDSDADTAIARYFKAAPHSDACPFCRGASS